MEIQSLRTLGNKVSEYMLTLMEHVVPFPRAYSPVRGELVWVDPRFLATNQAEFMQSQPCREIGGILESSQSVNDQSTIPSVRRKFFVAFSHDESETVLHLPLLKEWYHPSERPEKGGLMRVHREDTTFYRVLALEEIGEDEVVVTLSRRDDLYGFYLPRQEQLNIHKVRSWVPRERILADFAIVNDIRAEAMKAYRVFRNKGGDDKSADVFGMHTMNSFVENYSIYRMLLLTVDPALLIRFIEYVSQYEPNATLPKPVM